MSIWNLTFRFEELHSGGRAWLLGALVVLSATATGGEVSSLPTRLDGQWGPLQEAFSDVAASVGLPASSSLSLPISSSAPVEPARGALAENAKNAPASANVNGTANANTDSLSNTGASLGEVATSAPRSTRVGEFNAIPAAVSSGDLSDAGSAAGTGILNAVNQGNFDQVVGALQVAAGEPDTAAFRAPGGFGAGSIIAPPVAQGALIRGSVDKDSMASISGASAPRTQFGDISQFTMGAAGKRAGKGSRVASREEEAADSDKKDDPNKDRKEEPKKKLSQQEFQETLSKLEGRSAPFYPEDYVNFRNLISSEKDRLDELAKSPKFLSNARIIFPLFSDDDKAAKTALAKADFKNFVDGKAPQQQASAINDDFQQTLSGVSAGDEGATERINIERNSRPTGETH